jgi:hypothetical protein
MRPSSGMPLSISFAFSATRVPQQNGVVERKNCTLVEMARTMFDEHRTPRHFWADAISTTCYISNRIFQRSIFNLTPFELHFGCKLFVFHLRPFGCKYFVLKCGNLDKFESLSYPVPRNREQSLHTCAQDVQITRMATI